MKWAMNDIFIPCFIILNSPYFVINKINYIKIERLIWEDIRKNYDIKNMNITLRGEVYNVP